MVTDDLENIKLIDFGFAMEQENQTIMKSKTVGSPLYMSPEAMKGRYTAAGDIWSLGVSMFYLFTG